MNKEKWEDFRANCPWKNMSIRGDLLCRSTGGVGKEYKCTHKACAPMFWSKTILNEMVNEMKGENK